MQCALVDEPGMRHIVKQHLEVHTGEMCINLEDVCDD